MKKERNMKIIIKIFLVTLLSLFLVSCDGVVTEKHAFRSLNKHLSSKYGEEFEISNIRGIMVNRDMESYYEADIIPKRYVDTEKYEDKFLLRRGRVYIKNGIFGEKIDKTTDTYGIVRVSKAAGDFFMPKLEELFGKQVLPIFQIAASKESKEGNFIDTMKLNRTITIGGAIYIFGRIDNLDEKEVYQGKIFEFINYMMSEGLFEYVDIAIYILDERCLTDGFGNDVGYQLVEARRSIDTADEFIAYRRELMGALEEEFGEMAEDEKLDRIDRYSRAYILSISIDKSRSLDRIDNYDRVYMKDFQKNDLNKYSVIYYNSIRKGDFWRHNRFVERFWYLNRLDEIYWPLDYSSSEDVKLLNIMKIDYKEYDARKVYRNEWDGE